MDRFAEDFRRALESFRQGRLPDAEAHCTEILRAEPGHCDALHLAGLVALQAGQVPRSIELIGRSLAVRPDQAMAHMNLAHALLRAGKAQAALVSCDTALAQRPDYAEALNCRGNALLELRRPDEALGDYDQAVRLRPQLALLHNNRGNALRDLKRTQEALESYQRALGLQPGLREALLGSAGMLLALGRPHEAQARCDEALTRHADDGDALQLRARVSLECGLAAAALGDLEHALAQRPDSAPLLTDRGNVLCRLGRVDEALTAYRHARRISPVDAEVAANEGHALLLLRRYEEALACYEEVVALSPDSPKGHRYRAYMLRMLRRPDEALAASERALAIDPGYVAALNARGHALFDLGRTAEALDAYEQALKLDPDSEEGLANRGRTLLLAGQHEAGLACIERLRDVQDEEAPEYDETLSLLLHARLTSCDWREYEALYAELERRIDSDGHVVPASLYTASGLAPATHLRCARAYVEDNWGALARAAVAAPCHRHDRIRLAYVSADFRQHPVSQLMARVFELHDRARFETIGVATRAPDDSALGRRVVRAFDRLIDASRMQDSALAALLRELEIDVCVDLCGYTSFNSSAIFARRSAPVQVNYLGYPGTLGAAYIDYIIADETVIPPSAQLDYSEKVVCLPGCYLPPGDRPELHSGPQRRVDHGLPERGFVFCAFNTPTKIVPPVFDVWMRLLRAIEGSVLWLSHGSELVMRHLTEQAGRRGVAAERLVFAPRLPELEDHLARQRLADLFLDTTPYNAHTTAADALWAALPVLTCMGNAFASRVAASLLRALSLPQLITANLAEYESRALALAHGPELPQLKARLADVHAHPLFDAERFCRHLEAAYAAMRDRARRGEAPESFAVR